MGKRELGAVKVGDLVTLVVAWLGKYPTFSMPVEGVRARPLLLRKSRGEGLLSIESAGGIIARCG
jgi:hypothetical protein